MSIKLKTAVMKVKRDGQMKDVGMIFGDTAESIAAIQKTGSDTLTEVTTKTTKAISDIDAKTRASIDSIPDDYTELNNKIDVLNEDIDNLSDRVDNIDDVIIETVEPLQKQVDALERSNDALWKLAEGQLYDIETKTESGMNDAPSGAFSMSLEEVYGESLQETTTGSNVFAGKIESNIGASRLYSTYFELKAGTYFFNATQDISNGLIRDIDGTTAITGWIFNSSFTLQEDKTVRVELNYGSIADVSKRGVYYDGIFWINSGSSPKPYEKFTGGLPMPNPSFPAPITSVESITISSCGTNLFGGEFNVQYRFPRTMKKGEKITFSSSGVKSNNSLLLFTHYGDEIRNDYWTIGIDSSRTVVLTADTESFSIFNNVEGKYRVEIGESLNPVDSYSELVTTTITPPFPMNAVDSYRDELDVENGVWVKNTKRNILSSLAPFRKNSKLTNDGATVIFKMSNIAFEQNMPFMVESFKKVDFPTKWELLHHGEFTVDKGYIIFAAKNISDENEFLTEFANSGYVCAAENKEYIPISADDMEFFKSLENTSADYHITVTDQDGNDLEWLAEYIISLREVH